MSLIHLLPVLGTFLYVNMPKTYSPDPHDLRDFSIVHNLGLAVFSGYTCWSLGCLLWRDGFQHGHMIYFSDPAYDRLMFWFYLSKYYEYMDTFLLYMKKKQPIYLQKFHHVGAVICWHLCYVYKVDTVVLGTFFNSAVHTIMYSYYLLSLFNLRLGFIKPWITGIQLVQLSSGVAYSIYYYYPPVETWWNYSIILFFDAYIIVLISLFVDFFVKTYGKRSIPV
jgi:hypothetical protein